MEIHHEIDPATIKGGLGEGQSGWDQRAIFSMLARKQWGRSRPVMTERPVSDFVA